MNKAEKIVESYQRIKNLKLVGLELGIPWQTVYFNLKKSGISVTGDKSRYGSVTDRIAIIGEQAFAKSVPIAKSFNDIEFQSQIDFMIGDIKIDVKTSRLLSEQTKKNGKLTQPRWSFCINKQKEITDYFVLYALNDNLEIDKVFLMPQEIVTTKSLIRIPKSGKSKWFDFLVDESQLLPFFRDMLKIKS